MTQPTEWTIDDDDDDDDDNDDDNKRTLTLWKMFFM